MSTRLIAKNGKMVAMQHMKDGQLGEVVSPQNYAGQIVQCYRGSLGHIILVIGKGSGSSWSSKDDPRMAGSTNLVRLLEEGELIEVLDN
jgi:hypothetical protein